MLSSGAALFYNQAMPELPEVETIARGVNERVRGDLIVQVWFGSHKEPFKTPPLRQARGLEGCVVTECAPHGETHCLRVGPVRFEPVGPASQGKKAKAAADEQEAATPEAQWVVHLGMTGRLLVTSAEAPVATHTHARLSLASGRELRFVDPRRFGRLEFRIWRWFPLFGARRRAAHHWFRAVCRSLSWAEPFNQSCPAESDSACRRGQHLRGRVAVSRRHSPAAQRGAAHPAELERLRLALRQILAMPSARRVIGFRLCGRCGSARLLPA